MPGPKIETLIVRYGQRGMRLSDFLAAAWPRADRVFLRRLLADGRVAVNRMEASGQTKVGPGDEVRVTLPEGVTSVPARRRPKVADAPLEVLAENELCLAVDKPAGVPTIPDRAGHALGVYGALQELRPDDDLRVAHRLDRDTSGCLVLAKGLDGARWLDQAFRDGEVAKEYLALVEGRVARERFDVARALGPDPRRPGKVIPVPDGQKKSRPAFTSFEVERRYRRHTLLRVRPRTGRGHQIRVHLRSVGHPIVGDVDYGASGPLYLSSFKAGYKIRPGVRERPLLVRMFLHAERIVVPMPDDAESLEAHAPLPDDLARILRQLERFAAGADEGGGGCD